MDIPMSQSSTYKLSEEEKKFYEENGYLVIKGLIDEATLNNVRQRFLQMARKEVPAAQFGIIEDKRIKKMSNNPEDYVNKINYLAHDEVFMQYSEHPRLLDVLSQLIGDEMCVLNSMFINKPAGTPWHPPHQDIYFLPFSPVEHVWSTWTAIDAADENNGCLFVVPGSHKQKQVYEHEDINDYVNKFFYVIKDLDKIAPPEKRVNLSAEPGDVVFFHALLVHGSLPNNTEKPRKAIMSMFGSNLCKYADVSGTVRGTLRAAFEKEIKRKGYQGTYEEYWAPKIKILEVRDKTSVTD